MAEASDTGFVVKDSGSRQSFVSGMVRDTQTGKVQYLRVFDGPMLDRWAVHLTKGAEKYPDVAPGIPNWTLAAGDAEAERFRASAVRHFVQWLRGDRDEDHAAAVFFNVNGYETVRVKQASDAPTRLLGAKFVAEVPKPKKYLRAGAPIPHGTKICPNCDQTFPSGVSTACDSIPAGAVVVDTYDELA